MEMCGGRRGLVGKAVWLCRFPLEADAMAVRERQIRATGVPVRGQIDPSSARRPLDAEETVVNRVCAFVNEDEDQYRGGDLHPTGNIHGRAAVQATIHRIAAQAKLAASDNG